jgi:hypothetical protein
MAKPPTTKPSDGKLTETVSVSDGIGVTVTRAADQPAGPPPGVPALPLAVDFTRQSDWTKEVARIAYEAYIANSNGLAWDGRPCPKWEDLNNAVRSHWCAAVLGAAPIIRSKADQELSESTERVFQMDAALREASAEISRLMLRLEAAGAAPADARLAEKLAQELKVCREQLSIANAAVKERDQKLRAIGAVGDQAALKYAADRTAMLDGEVDKLRAEVARLESALRERA